MPVATRSGAKRAGAAMLLEGWSGSQLAQLPTELVEEVLRCLPAQDVVAAALSCKYVSRAAFCDRIWHVAFQRTFPSLIEVLEACPPRWWKQSSWHRRYKRVSQGAVFSAQILNREADNSSEDFMLSAYDAKVSVERPLQPSAPTFTAKYLPMGAERVTEKGVTVERMRKVPQGTSPRAVYPTQGHEWRQGDAVELQWKAHVDHPYGWWLGKVKEVHSDRLVLLFQQYPGQSPWRTIVVPLDHGPVAPSNWHPAYGYVGGARRVEPAEQQQWQKYHKKALQRDVDRNAPNDEPGAAAAAPNAAAPDLAHAAAALDAAPEPAADAPVAAAAAMPLQGAAVGLQAGA